MESTFIGQVGALIQKTYVVKKKTKIDTYSEIFTGLYYIIVLVILKNTIPSGPSHKVYSPITSLSPALPFAYVPDPSNNVSSLLPYLNYTAIQSYQSEQSLIDYYTDNPETLWGGVVFHQVDQSSNNINFTIRLNISYSNIQSSPYPYVEQSILSAFTISWSDPAFTETTGFMIMDFVLYSLKVTAVDSLNLEIESGAIFALLGHNGAGKSTTMSMLTGVQLPTSGRASINGLDVVTQMRQIRQHLGYCPQTNILYNQLTCGEHLRLYAKIKGVPRKDIPAMIVKSLTEVDLLDKKDTVSASLSGGMKRRLCLAIAFIGDPSIVFLDECTSGLDPYARHQVWELLQQKKAGRTIVLSTHYMEEAECLAEKIAIMSNGKIRAMGTAMNLKSLFGLGYVMSVTFDREDANIQGFEDIFYSMFIDAKPGSSNKENQAKESSGEIEQTYALDYQLSEKLAQFFEEIEPKQKQLGISTIGISMTTLEEVFLKILMDKDQTSDDS
eukprot:gene12967-15238_t